MDSNVTRSTFRDELALGWKAYAAEISQYIRSMDYQQVQAWFNRDCSLNFKSCYAVYLAHQVMNALSS